MRRRIHHCHRPDLPRWAVQHRRAGCVYRLCCGAVRRHPGPDQLLMHRPMPWGPVREHGRAVPRNMCRCMHGRVSAWQELVLCYVLPCTYFLEACCHVYLPHLLCCMSCVKRGGGYFVLTCPCPCMPPGSPTGRYYCPAGSTSAIASICPPGQFSTGAAALCTSCAAGLYGATQGLSSAGACMCSRVPFD